jgi:hypothetical protein
LAVLILTLVLCAYVPIQQQILRHRAEKLLADIRTLQLRKSTWADAEILMKRWGAWGHYEGSCNQSECHYQINLLDPFTRLSIAPASAIELLGHLRTPFNLLGGRIAGVGATWDVRDGVVWEKQFAMMLEAPQPNLFGANPYPRMILTYARTVSRFPTVRASSLKDSEIAIRSPGGCEANCEALFLEFTPYAEPQNLDHLLQFDLSCITRLVPCRNRSEVMPAAWKEMMSASSGEDWKRIENCELSLQVRGRDSQRSLLVQLLAKPQRTEDGYFGLKLRLLKHLKNSDPWELNSEQEVFIGNHAVAGTPHNSVSDLKPGDQYIILFEDFSGKTVGPFRELKTVSVDRCGLIPATVENLAAIQAGIERDFASKPRRQPLPLP